MFVAIRSLFIAFLLSLTDGFSVFKNKSQPNSTTSH